MQIINVDTFGLCSEDLSSSSDSCASVRSLDKLFEIYPNILSKLEFPFKMKDYFIVFLLNLKTQLRNLSKKKKTVYV